MTFIERTDIFRPPLVRLLARHKSGKALTTQEISTKCQMPAYQIQAIADMADWNGVMFGDLCKFCDGCGLGNLEDGETMHRTYNYIRFAARPGTIPFRYLKNDQDWESYYKPLIIRWRKIYGRQIEGVPWAPVRKLLVRLTPLVFPSISKSKI
jgi:hypothetical protein